MRKLKKGSRKEPLGAAPVPGYVSNDPWGLNRVSDPWYLGGGEDIGRLGFPNNYPYDPRDISRVDPFGAYNGGGHRDVRPLPVADAENRSEERPKTPTTEPIPMPSRRSVLTNTLKDPLNRIPPNLHLLAVVERHLQYVLPTTKLQYSRPVKVQAAPTVQVAWVVEAVLVAQIVQALSDQAKVDHKQDLVIWAVR